MATRTARPTVTLERDGIRYAFAGRDVRSQREGKDGGDTVTGAVRRCRPNARLLLDARSLLVFGFLVALVLPLRLGADASGSGKTGWQFSGLADAKAKASWVPAYQGDEQGRFGLEQYGNLRLEAPLGQRGKVFAALNLQSAAGSLWIESLGGAGGGGSAGGGVPGSGAAGGSAARSFVLGQGYASRIEVERFYYRLEFERSDWEAGLLRVPFGYGQIWRPTDFLNPPNPLISDARPRGVLGTVYTLYSASEWDWEGRFFAAGGRDPTRLDAAGSVGGVSMEVHAPRFSLQALYALAVPGPGKRYPAHRIGLAYKWDGPVSLVMDALFLMDEDSRPFVTPWKGLEAAVGVDGSRGDLVWVLQYLFHGSGALDTADSLAALYEPAAGDWKRIPPAERTVAAGRAVGELNRRHYGSATLLYQWGKFTQLSLSATACLEDGSFVPSLRWEHEMAQGFTVSATLRGFFDGELLGYGAAGELGPLHAGSRAELTLNARLRF